MKQINVMNIKINQLKLTRSLLQHLLRRYPTLHTRLPVRLQSRSTVGSHSRGRCAGRALQIARVYRHEEVAHLSAFDFTLAVKPLDGGQVDLLLTRHFVRLVVVLF